MPLTQTDVLMIDSIVITGVLILLTITTIGIGSENPSFFSVLWKALVIITVFPFALSAYIQLSPLLKKSPDKTNEASRKSLYVMQLGFVYMMLMLLSFLIIEFIIFASSNSNINPQLPINNTNG